jgi:hypothetical protein
VLSRCQPLGIECARPAFVNPAARACEEPTHGLNIAPHGKEVFSSYFKA